ncbi:hypothetical protein D3C72_1289740 [compost metagenome]
MVSSDTSAEFLMSAMNSLPSGGIMRTTACGSTIWRIATPGVMPSDCAAMVWPLSIDWIAPRTISDT